MTDEWRICSITTELFLWPLCKRIALRKIPLGKRGVPDKPPHASWRTSKHLTIGMVVHSWPTCALLASKKSGSSALHFRHRYNRSEVREATRSSLAAFLETGVPMSTLRDHRASLLHYAYALGATADSCNVFAIPSRFGSTKQRTLTAAMT